MVGEFGCEQMNSVMRVSAAAETSSPHIARSWTTISGDMELNSPWILWRPLFATKEIIIRDVQSQERIQIIVWDVHDAAVYWSLCSILRKFVLPLSLKLWTRCSAARQMMTLHVKRISNLAVLNVPRLTSCVWERGRHSYSMKRHIEIISRDERASQDNVQESWHINKSFRYWDLSSRSSEYLHVPIRLKTEGSRPWCIHEWYQVIVLIWSRSVVSNLPFCARTSLCQSVHVCWSDTQKWHTRSNPNEKSSDISSRFGLK